MRLKEIIDSFKKTNDSSSFLYRNFIRPFSFLLTWFLIKLGLQSPNKATLIGMIFGLSAVTLIPFAAQNDTLLIFISLIYFTYLSLDVVDGNLARVFNRATYFGKFLDGFVDTIIEGGVILAIIIAYFLKSGSTFLLIIGLINCWIFLLAAVLMNRFAFFRLWLESDGKKQPLPKQSTSPTNGTILNILIDARVAFILVLPITNLRQEWYLAYMLSILLLSISLWITFAKNAYATLNVSRISKSDAKRSQ